MSMASYGGRSWVCAARGGGGGAGGGHRRYALPFLVDCWYLWSVVWYEITP